MTLADDIAKANAEHDPHGFRLQGANSAKHAETAVPYKYQQFPMHVHMHGAKEGEVLSKAVANQTELRTAKQEGWSETLPEKAAAAEGEKDAPTE